MRYFIFLLFFLGSFSCESVSTSNVVLATIKTPESVSVDSTGMTIASRFAPPVGAKRDSFANGSFGAYLQGLPLYPPGRAVQHFDGSLKQRQEVAAAVLQIDVGTRDLQQCADAVMRLRAEYLWQQGRYSEIQFTFSNGFKAPYSKWRAGQRIAVGGNVVSWYPQNSSDGSYATFRKYLNMVFAYANTASLAGDLQKVTGEGVQIGDVFLQPGYPGHAVLVVDTATDPATGARYFLLAQSYMPAQDIHLLVNPNSPEHSPWYLFQPNLPLHTPEWGFAATDHYRF